MINVLSNYNLQEVNTFGISVVADQFIVLQDNNDIKEFLKTYIKSTPLLVLGGGSNVLFTADFSGTIVKPDIQGIEIIMENDNEVRIRVGAGVEWDTLVGYTVEKGWGGLENLSIIPGTVGASPIQNIGAYGVEVKESIWAVEGFFIDSGKHFNFKNQDCQFDYRSSIFKTTFKNNIIVSHVVFRLFKNHVFKLNYGNLESIIAELGGINLANVRKAIIQIRESKLPDPQILGNAGSFFKNPIIKSAKAEEMRNLFPDHLPLFGAGENLFKISAAFLIEKVGLKGFRMNNVGVHEKQALVLVNYGNATGNEIVALSKLIQEKVFSEFGILLEPEVNFVPFIG